MVVHPYQETVCFHNLPSSHIFYPKASKGSHENATAGRTRCEATAKEMEEKDRRDDNMAIVMKRRKERTRRD